MRLIRVLILTAYLIYFNDGIYTRTVCFLPRPHGWQLWPLAACKVGGRRMGWAWLGSGGSKGRNRNPLDRKLWCSTKVRGLSQAPARNLWLSGAVRRAALHHARPRPDGRQRRVARQGGTAGQGVSSLDCRWRRGARRERGRGGEGRGCNQSRGRGRGDDSGRGMFREATGKQKGWEWRGHAEGHAEGYAWTADAPRPRTKPAYCEYCSLLAEAG